MKNNFKQKFLALLLFFITVTAVQAQEALPCTGGEAMGNGGLVSYTVGQAVYTTSIGTNGSVTQGVQQPYEILVVSGIEQGKSILLECEVFPNPVSDYLKLKIDALAYSGLGVLHYQLFNTNGKLLGTSEINLDETRIDMHTLPQGSYIIHVSNEDVKLRTFKIIKK